MTIHLTPRMSLFLSVVFVLAAAIVAGAGAGCARNDDATNFYANMDARGVGKH